MMRRRHRSFALALILALGVVATSGAMPRSAVAEQFPVVPLQAGQDGDLELCLDANGEPKSGEIDVLLLIDDSGSLEAVRRPTDPDKRRFDALRVLLRGLSASDDTRPVNVAAVTFGERISVERTFQRLEPGDVDAIVDDLRAVATGRQRLTLYADGLRRAIQLLRDRPVQNCRFMIFFTDGGHDASNRTDPATDAAEAAGLRRDVCEPGGIRETLRAENINLFVLLLTPPEDNPQRLEASKDVMQVLTGDGRPAFVGDDGVARVVPRAPTGDCSGPLGPRTGLVLPVAEADQLPGLFADLPNIAAGGVAPIACPYTIGEVTTAALPDAHLVEWLSLTDYGATTTPVSPTLRNLVITTRDGTLSATDVLETISESPPSARFRVRPDARPLLEAGWSIRVIQAQDLCLRLRPTVPEFRLSTAEPQVQAVRPARLPAALFEGDRLELRASGSNVRISVEEALRSPVVVGRLRVENGEIFDTDGSIPVRVVINGAPVLGPGCGTIQIPAPGLLAVTAGRGDGLEAPTDVLASSICEIVPATLGDGGVVSWAKTLDELNGSGPSCRDGELIGLGWTVFVDGRPAAADRIELIAGGAPVKVELRSTVAPENAALDCTGAAVAPVVLEWQGRSSEIPISLSAAWLRRSSPVIAALIAAPLMLLVILLSMGVLWFINKQFMGPPDPSKLWGLEASGILELDRRGVARVVWDGGGSRLTVSGEALVRVSAHGSGGLRTDGASRLERSMPPLYRPLAEPVLELAADEDRIAVSHPPAPRGQGSLPMGFRSAIILSTRSRRLPEPGEGVPVRLVVLAPREADLSGTDVVEAVLDQQLGGLVDRLMERLREVAAEGAGGHGELAGGPSAPPDDRGQGGGWTGPSSGPPPIDGPPT
jgi:hypothetical protein